MKLDSIRIQNLRLFADAPRSNLDYWEPKLARTQERD